MNDGKKMFSWMNPNLEVKKTEKYGKGVFAKKDLMKGDRLAIFGGYIFPIKNLNSLSVDYQDSGIQISEEFSLTCLDHFEDTDFFNHSCEPNAGIGGQIFLVAMKDIKLGEEITFDYAMCLHAVEGVLEYKFECMCGVDKCRGVITENDWKNKELQAKYDGYFQYFLQEKINKNKTNDLS